MKAISLSSVSRAHLVTLVRARFKQDADLKQKTVLMSGLNCDQWCDAIDKMSRKEHEAGELEALPNMARYFGMASTRIDATVSWRQDLLLNTAEAPFTLKPTPIPTMGPEVNEEATTMILNELWSKLGESIPPTALVASGRPVDAVRKLIAARVPEMKKTRAAYLNKQATNMALDAELLVKDLTNEGGWRKAFWGMQRAQTKYPVAIMCGPELVPVSQRSYGRNGSINRKSGLAQQWRMVDLRNFYFGTDSVSASTGRGCTEVRFKNRGRLVQAMNNKDYDVVALRAVLDEFEAVGRDWLTEGYDEKSAVAWSTCEHEEVAVLIHHGQISGRELLDANITGVDRYKMYEVRLEVIGSHTVYCQLADYQDDGTGKGDAHARPYFSTSWKVDDNTPYGRSLGMMLRDPQLLLNRLQYFIMANAYNAHLPMTELSSSKLASPMDWYFQPGAAFENNVEAKIEGENRSITMHQSQPMFQQLMGLFVDRMKLVDDEIGITAVSYGSMVMTPDDKTLGGQLQRISGSARGLKDAIYNQDLQVIEPSITRSVRLLQDKRLVMGDINVDARGATSLIQRDTQSSQQKEILPILITAAQEDPARFGRAKIALLTEVFSAAGVPRDLMPDSALEDEFKTAVLSGLPATPQLQADGRSLNADKLAAKL